MSLVCRQKKEVTAFDRVTWNAFVYPNMKGCVKHFKIVPMELIRGLCKVRSGCLWIRAWLSAAHLFSERWIEREAFAEISAELSDERHFVLSAELNTKRWVLSTELSASVLEIWALSWALSASFFWALTSSLNDSCTAAFGCISMEV